MPSFDSCRLTPDDDLGEWDAFVNESPQGCIFCRSWWLRAVAPGSFRILTLRKPDRIVAGIPMVFRRRLGYCDIGMPKLTQTLGALIEPSQKTRYADRLSDEMSILKALVASIPNVERFAVNFHYSFDNWLPFHWGGYSQSTRYTYVIPDIRDAAAVRDQFSGSARYNLRKAQRESLLIEAFEDVDLFYEVNKLSFDRQSRPIPYGIDLVRRIHTACGERGANLTLLAKDRSDRIHSAIYVVFDQKSAYLLMSGGDPDLRSSQAKTLLVWEAIQRL